MHKVARRNRCDNAVAFRQLSELPGDMATRAPKLLERWVENFPTWCIDVVEGVERDCKVASSRKCVTTALLYPTEEVLRKARPPCLLGEYHISWNPDNISIKHLAGFRVWDIIYEIIAS